MASGAREMIARLLVPARVVVQPAEGAAYRDGGRIELLRGVPFDERFVQPSARREQEAVPLMRRRVLRVELDRATELPPRFLPAPVVHEQHPRQRRVRLRQRLVERQRLARVALRQRESFRDRHAAVVELQRVGVGEPGVRQRVLRIFGDGALEVLDGLQHALLRALVPARSVRGGTVRMPSRSACTVAPAACRDRRTTSRAASPRWCARSRPGSRTRRAACGRSAATTAAAHRRPRRAAP